MLAFSKLKSFLRFVIGGVLFPVFALIGIATLSGISSGEHRLYFAVFGLIVCFLALVAFFNSLFGLGGLLGRRILLKIQEEAIIFYNRNPLTLRLEAIELPMEQIKSLAIGDIDVLGETFSQQGKQILPMIDLVLNLANKPSLVGLSKSSIESIRFVFFTDVLPGYSMFKHNIWYNRRQLTLDVQTNFCNRKDCKAFVIEASYAITQLYGAK